MPAFAGRPPRRVDRGRALRSARAPGQHDTVSATETLTLLGSGSIRVVKVGPDGAIYALTDDAVLRVTPRDLNRRPPQISRPGR